MMIPLFFFGNELLKDPIRLVRCVSSSLHQGHQGRVAHQIAGPHAKHFVPERLPWQAYSSGLDGLGFAQWILLIFRWKRWKPLRLKQLQVAATDHSCVAWLCLPWENEDEPVDVQRMGFSIYSHPRDTEEFCPDVEPNDTIYHHI